MTKAELIKAPEDAEIKVWDDISLSWIPVTQVFEGEALFSRRVWFLS